MIHDFGKKDGSLPIEELLESLNEYLEDIYWVDDNKVLKILDRGSFKHSNIKESEVLLARIMLNKLNDFRYRIKEVFRRLRFDKTFLRTLDSLSCGRIISEKECEEMKKAKDFNDIMKIMQKN